MLKVVKATELDGITPKDGDVGRKLSYTGVNRRIGLELYSPKEIDSLKIGYNMLLYDAHDNSTLHTSSINEIVRDDKEIRVITRNTIYFIEDVEI